MKPCVADSNSSNETRTENVEKLAEKKGFQFEGMLPSLVVILNKSRISAVQAFKNASCFSLEESVFLYVIMDASQSSKNCRIS